VHVVHGSDEIVDVRTRSQLRDEGRIVRSDPLALETDEEMNLGGVFLAETHRFDEECLVTGPQE
jgi:hypothetical protein